jgi:hypothetical protein
MADAVTTTTVFNGTQRLVVHLTNVSDGTGESNVVKVDKSTFTGPNGSEPTNFVLERVDYDVSSMRVLLTLDRTTDQTLVVLQGQGTMDFTSSGGLLKASTGDTGDILLTTANHAAGDGYDITLYLRKKN